MHRIISSFFVVTVLSNLFWLIPGGAQTGNGTITGATKDERNASLPSASIEVQPSGRRAVSDDQGQFRISDVPAGEYTLTASYVGFANFSKTVTVIPGQTVVVDAVLKVASQSDQVIVTAERARGEAEAINIERMAENIVQVLPSNVINSLPNTNVADAVGRAPSVTLERDEGEGKYVQIRGTEPRLSNVTIDGVNVPSPEATVRNIKLDIIPAGIVDRIEVNKTLSANQDGDAIGGSVNLVTKTPGERPTINVSAEGGYTPIQNGRWLNAFNGTVGQRFGPDKKVGALMGFSYDFNGRGIDDLEPTQAIVTAPSGQNVAAITSEDLRTYKYYRTRYGFDGGLDYSLGSGSSVYIKGLYSDFHDFGDVWVYTPNAGGAVTAVDGPQITFDNTGSAAYRHYIRRPDQQIFSVLMGARHDLSSTLISYEFAVSRAHNIGGQDFPTTNYNGPSGITYAANLSNPYRPKLVAVDGTNTLDPNTYSISNTSLPIYHSTQLNFQGAASLARRYNIHSHYSTFELGIKIRNAHKTQFENDHFFDANPGTNFTLAQTEGTYSNPTYYDHSFTLGPFTDYHKIQQIIASNLSTGFTDNTDKDRIVSDPATWDTSERVYAGYAMNTIAFSKFRLQTGLRIEGTSSSYTANQVTLNNGAYVATTPVFGNGSYVNFLPSVQLQYLLGKDTNIRASYGRGISRPNFSDLVPSVQVDPNTSPKSLQIGNPSLKPTKASNYDLLIEHFFRPLGILQGGFFYKQLSDPIYPTISIVQTGQFAGFQQQQSINGPNAHIAGVEAAWEQRLSWLPGPLGGFGVAANYSYTTSQVSFPAGFSGGRIDHPSLQRQAPNTWNLGFTYDNSRFSMRFGASHNDANIYAYGFVHVDPQTDRDPILGIRGPLGDQYLYAHTQFDIQGSFRLYKGLHFVAYGLNLSNEVFGFYTGSPIYPNQREYYHPTVAAGVRWSSGTE